MKHTDTFNPNPSPAWFARSYSRRLRKLYRELDAVTAEMDAVRASNPCPDHAPTSCRIIWHRLRELRPRYDALIERIIAIQHE